MKHLLIVTATSIDKPTTYKAICGYESTDAKEFTNPITGTWAQVDCEKCLEKKDVKLTAVGG
jgi:hypothetical protein